MNDRNDKNRSRQSKDARNPQFRPRKKPVKAASGKPSPTAKHPKPLAQVLGSEVRLQGAPQKSLTRDVGSRAASGC